MVRSPDASTFFSIDLMEPAIPMKEPGVWFLHGGEGMKGSDSQAPQSEAQDPPELSGIFMLVSVPFDLIFRSQRFSPLAQRLQGLRSKVENATSSTAMCRGRSKVDGISMPRIPSAKAETEPARGVNDMCNGGLRLLRHGSFRRVGPHPNLTRLALMQIQKEPSHREGGQWKTDGAQQ